VYGHTARAGGWGRGSYPMMPGSAGSSSAESGAARNTVTAAASENWAGYAAAATGTEADCAASYQGWFEMFPAAPVFFSETVRPGDAMSASVVANGGGSFTLTLTDSTQGWTKVTRQTSDTAQLGSAEIIAEAPSDGNGDVLPLSDFGAVTFTDALIDTNVIGTLNTAEIAMESAGNVADATPSALTDGDEFTVTVDSNGGPGTTGAPGTTGGHRHRHHHHGSAG
jgi:hypothetical protein